VKFPRPILVLSRFTLVVSLFVCTLLMGCGGGGGTAAPFTYSTVWVGTTPSNASQFVRILNSNGGVVLTFNLNRAGATSSQYVAQTLASGVYEVRAEQYSQSDAQGVLMGVARTIITVGGSSGARFDTSSSDSAASITVSPSTASLTEQQSKTFVPTVLSTSSRALFVKESDVTWSVTGGIGSVASNGVLTATTAGNGAVRATYTPSGYLGASAVTVTPFVTKHGKWTVIVFLNAANDLAPYSDLNVNQMEQVAGNPDVRFVIQWKQSQDVYPSSSFDGVRRYVAKYDTTNAIASDLVQSNLVDGQGNALDMGIPDTLRNFVIWAQTYYPADRYALVLWSHGNGWLRKPSVPSATRDISYDYQTGNSIRPWQLSQALAGLHLDIIASDACMMQMLEVAYEIRGSADYIVGSEENTPGPGYPYDTVFAPFRDTPTDTTLNLSKSFVDNMLAVTDYMSMPITQSVIDTSKLPAVATATGNLASALIGADQNLLAGYIPGIRSNAQSYQPTTARVYRDVTDLCSRIEAVGAMPAPIVTASQNLRAAVANAVVYEGHNAHSPGSHGLSIDFSSATVFSNHRFDYMQMKIAQDTTWPNWLQIAP